jgi:hypothetical protein
MKMHLEDIDQIRLAVSKQIPQARKSKLGQFMTPAPIARFMASLFDQAVDDSLKAHTRFTDVGRVCLIKGDTNDQPHLYHRVRSGRRV